MQRGALLVISDLEADAERDYVSVHSDDHAQKDNSIANHKLYEDVQKGVMVEIFIMVGNAGKDYVFADSDDHVQEESLIVSDSSYNDAPKLAVVVQHVDAEHRDGTVSS